jgi:hypothetical protein
MLTSSNGSTDNSIDKLILGYLDVASRELNNGEFSKHKEKVYELMNSKNLSKDAVLEIMTTLLNDNEESNGGESYNDTNLTNILKGCKDFIWTHLIGSKKDIVDITDTDAVIKISDLVTNVLALKPFSSGNEELSIILASYLLNKIHRPCLIIEESEKNDFIDASTNKIAMRLFIAEKYKQSFISQNNRFYKLVEVYENASKYKSDGIPGSYTVQWHELNAAINGWKSFLS